MKPQYDLSILIPARNEMFLAQTVKNILENIRGNTEIIIVLDGAWANPGIANDPRVTIIYHNKSVGQRAATNEACLLSKAKYVMKLDAHCALDEGFDVKLLSEMKDDYTMIPTMYNLHAFDWKCRKCGNSWYQGPTPKFCCRDHEGKTKNENCDNTTDFERVLIWKPRLNRKSNYYRFDKDLHFQYWGDYGNRPEAQGDVVPILSAQGSCFLLTRAKYWELDICDERHGSWGQQGVEVACKTWLSGGTLVLNKKTWYSHMFRTQGRDFGFPYPISGREVDRARQYSKELWLQNKWDKAKHDLQWLLDKFAPVPQWHDNSTILEKESKNMNTVVSKKVTKGIVYYTHGVGDKAILEACRRQLLKGMKAKHITSVSNAPLDFGNNIVFPHLEVMGFVNMFIRILIGLEASTADVVFFCEHDVLYHPSHFDFLPSEKNVYYYNTNVWRVRKHDGHALWVDDLKQLSGMVAYRELLLKHYKERLKKIVKEGFSLDMGFEPGTHGRESRVDDFKVVGYMAKYPNIDIRHDTNATASRWNKEEFRNKRYTQGWKEADEIPGWGKTLPVFEELLEYK